MLVIRYNNRINCLITLVPKLKGKTCSDLPEWDNVGGGIGLGEDVVLYCYVKGIDVFGLFQINQQIVLRTCWWNICVFRDQKL
jgi:hypothetical protein